MSKKRTAIYIRVSTERQDAGFDTQLGAARAYCREAGYPSWYEFTDKGCSGADEGRPALAKLLRKVRRQELDTVVVYSLNRLSRRVTHSYFLLNEFRRRGVKLVSLSEEIDFETPEGELLFGVLAVLSDYQLKVLSRGIRAGLKRAKANGVILGRPSNRPDSKIKELLSTGATVLQVSRRLGVSRASVYRAAAKATPTSCR